MKYQQGEEYTYNLINYVDEVLVLAQFNFEWELIIYVIL